MAEMTLTETLFGGLLVTVFIFFMTKKIGLANFWSGVLGAVVSITLVQIGQVVTFWPFILLFI